ncbi:peptidase S8/S53 domain-containing protein, partial [Lobosporangium transversale]
PHLQSAHILTGVTAVHQKLNLTGKGIKVGIIDTGIDYTHPALGGCFGPGCKVAYGHDFVGDDYDSGNPEKDIPKPDNDPMDCGGHGTHVAGIVAARNEGPDTLGPQGFVGVAPDVTLGAYRVFGCGGDVSDDVLLAAL